jgi:hypothetical protein
MGAEYRKKEYDLPVQATVKLFSTFPIEGL